MTGRLRLLTCAEHVRADEAAAALGAPLAQLMKAAGGAVAGAIVKRWAARPALVLCGPGDNGGDGHVAARLLKALGWPVRVAALEPGGGASAEARAARAAWDGAAGPLDPGALTGAELVVDALFGAGLSRPLEGAAAATLAAAGAGRAPIIAIDVPSGLAGDTGTRLGPVAAAALTVTFLRKKPAHLLAGEACGEIALANIGHPPAALDALGPAALWENDPALWPEAPPWPGAASHKHKRGRLIVVTGGAGRTGAARLAARAGLRAGAGLVTLYCPPSALLVAAAVSTAVMTTRFADAAALGAAGAQADAAIIGPAAGTDETTAANALALKASGPALVLDADALTVFADDPSPLFAPGGGERLLTPHEGEFRRLFPDIDLSDRIAAVRAAAARAGAVVLLKGAATVIAAPSGRAIVSAHASPFLATAGAGDVLAGLAGGLMAQGTPAFEAAAAAAWIHGEAALRLGPGLIAEDLVEALPGVLRSLSFHRRP